MLGCHCGDRCAAERCKKGTEDPSPTNIFFKYGRAKILKFPTQKAAFAALFHDLCKHGKWHKIQNGNRAGKSQDGLPPIIAY